MKNKKGFTLIELLAVIVVLAIIITIATGSVISSINKSKEKAKFIAAKEIVEIAQAYMEENDVNVVTVGELKDADYLEDDITNPMTGNNNDLEDNYGVYKDTKSTESSDLQDSGTSYHLNGYVFSSKSSVIQAKKVQDKYSDYNSSLDEDIIDIIGIKKPEDSKCDNDYNLIDNNCYPNKTDDSIINNLEEYVKLKKVIKIIIDKDIEWNIKGSMKYKKIDELNENEEIKKYTSRWKSIGSIVLQSDGEYDIEFTNNGISFISIPNAFFTDSVF